MTQEITYDGCSATPSDYTSPDGDLSLSVGLVPEDGALRPLPPPRAVFSAGEGCSVVFVHETNSFWHYIISDTSGNLYWVDADGDTSVKTPLVSLGSSVKLHQVNAVGNTLILLTEEGMRYFLWKAADGGSYKDLGNGLPEIPISFGLKKYGFNFLNFGTAYENTIILPEENTFGQGIKESCINSLTNGVLALVNTVVDFLYGKGYFVFPFFVRYAFRLYDGTLTKHSAPVLMIPRTNYHLITIPSINGGGPPTSGQTYNSLIASLSNDLYGCLLDYGITEGYGRSAADNLQLLRDFSDIITSVDIFVSAPIYTYNQSGTCGSPTDGKWESHGLYRESSHANSPYEWKLHSSTGWFIPLPSFVEDTFNKNITNCSNFYLFKSLSIDKLKIEEVQFDIVFFREEIHIEDDYLNSIVEKEQMTDDYDSHDILMPSFSYVYNNRLNITDLKKLYFKGYDPVCLFCCCKDLPVKTDGSPNENEDNIIISDIYVHIKDYVNGEVVVHRASSSMKVKKGNVLLWLYYPNVNAYKAQLYIENANNNSWKIVEVNLKKHDFLNGAYFYNNWDGIDLNTGKIVNSKPSYGTSSMEVSAKIYTSEVNNPFYFPVEGINTVGTGRVLGISSATKALSQGQFGQFPLYAFTTDGVWALEVSSTGTYSARQPVTRDVCIDPASITQLDDSVLFATDRGIMLISGSETVCITDTINPDGNPFALSSLPRADALLGRYNKSLSDDTEAISTGDLSLPSFASFIKGCRMVYDYVNQRIITYNPDVRFAYVYSLKSRTWGMMLSRIASNVNSYPEALAMDFDGNLVDFSTSDAAAVPVFAVTRPFKLGDPDVLKTIDTVIQRGCLTARDHVAQVLYGSRDMVNWHIIWSSTDIYLRGFRGSPYKYFRLMLIGRLSDGESLHGCTVQFTPRMLNRPR